MKIIKKEALRMDLKGSGYHVLTFAETGFAMLNAYGSEFGLDRETIEKFSQTVNSRDESGSLHPRAPISAVPRHLIRDDQNSETLAQQIKEFLVANQRSIGAKKILLDFRAGVAPFVVEACDIALQCPSAGFLDEVVIVITNSFDDEN